MAETDSESESSSSPPPNNTPNIIQYPFPPGWITPGITPSPNLPQLYPVMPHQLPPIGFTSASPPASSGQSTIVPQQTTGRRTRSSQSKTKKAPAQKKKATSRKKPSAEKEAPAKKKTPHRPWTTDQGTDGKSSLVLIVDWLTTGENYNMWRKGDISKREVAEKIVEYLVQNGIEGRGWEGVEQQVRHLEGKFRDALTWKMQTGEGIMEAAREKDTAARRERDREREVRRELGINEPEDDEGTEDFVGAATNETEAAIKKICPFYFDLESIFMDRASAVPLHLAESGVADDQTEIREALRLNNAEEDRAGDPTTIESTSTVQLPSSTQPPSSLSAAARSSASLKRVRSEAENSATTAAKKSNAERITERIFPSKEEMDAQRTEDQSLARERLANDKRLVDVTAQLARSLNPDTMDSGEAKSVQIKKTELDLEIQSYDFEQRKNAKDLERKQYEMNVSKAEAELAAVKFRRDHEQLQVEKARAELEESKANSKALTRAKMIQDFLRAGVALADAITTTNQLMDIPK
ncbi:hypothetical protein KEM48_007214 [Puccinia striiformis f. sp. tritici PST-130]|nr:hypothetical protein KEM48_007214 [Puccinia striiformis f. sp. tritici PST-130]